MKIPMLDLSRQHAPLKADLLRAAERVLDHGQFILGEEVRKFEHSLSSQLDGAAIVGVSSGTDALLVSLMALELPAGAEVVVPCFSFFATAGVVHRLGLKPVFVDVCPRSFNARDTTIASAIGPNTGAVLPVYLFGQMTSLHEISHPFQSVPIVEDAAQALGARFNEKGLACYAPMAATSFFPTKNLGGFGDGGAVITFDDVFAERVRMLRVHGSKPKYTHHKVGGNFRLDSLQAALLAVKLCNFEDQIQARQAVAKRYGQLFAETGLEERGLVIPPYKIPESTHTYNQYVIRCHDRDALRLKMSTAGISTMVYYPSPLHLQPCFAHLGYAAGDFPNAEEICEDVLALPCFPGLTIDEQRLVVDSIRAHYGV